MSLVITGVLWLVSKCVPVRIFVPIVLDYPALTDIQTLASGTGQCDETVLAQKKRQHKLKLFSMILEIF